MVEAVLAYTLKCIDEASSTMQEVRASTGLLGSAIGELGGGFSSLGNVMTGFAGAGVVGAVSAGVGEVIKGLKWSVEEAAQSEQAIKNLSIAVEKSGTAWDSVKEGTLSALSNLQKFTTYSDEQVAGALQKLLTFGLSYDEAMKALGSTVDLAAAKHMDLESAATIVGKAMDGNTTILKRYGINVITAKDATAALKAATDTVAASLEANKGSLDGFKDSLGDMGIKVNDSAGKMRGLKDIAKDLVDALAAGKIDTETYGQTLADLGIDVDTLKLSAADADDVLAALNTQFGGTAQEQAKTYAGIQERLKNATSDLGEKIGGMVLPALAGMTEAMIPIVDWFGKGVDTVQAWLTEVAKMPEVKGVMDALGSAFDGFRKYLNDLWSVIASSVGPALQELWQAFKDLWDALSPIGEVLGEIFSAISGGGEGLDFFKFTIQAIALEIRGFAEIIKLIAPYIRAFAEAFKAAADLALPIITQIKDAIVGFLDTLKAAFQGFYNWLVGGSLWQDLWNALGSIATGGVASLLGALGTTFLDPIKTAFETAGEGMKTAWDTAWEAIQTTTQSIWDDMKTNASTWINGLEDTISDAVRKTKENWDDVWNNFQKVSQGVWDSIESKVTPWIGGIKKNIEDALGALGKTWDTIWNALSTTVGSLVPKIKTTVEGIGSTFNALGGQLKTVWDNLKTAFNEAIKSIQDALASGWETIRTTAISIWDDVAKRSTEIVTKLSSDLTTIWSGIQGMVESVMTGVEETMTGIITNIQEVFVNSFTNMKQMFDTMVGGIQTLWNMAWGNIERMGNAIMKLISGDVAGFTADTASTIQDMGAQVTTATSSAWNTVTSTISGALNSASKAVSNFWNWLVGGSVWPEGLDQLIAVTAAKMNVLVGVVQQKIAQMQAEYAAALAQMQVQTPSAVYAAQQNIANTLAAALPQVDEGELVSYLTQAIIANVPITAPFPEAGPAPAAVASQLASVTLPVNVQIDGTTVSRVIEKRLIANRQLSAWRSPP